MECVKGIAPGLFPFPVSASETFLSASSSRLLSSQSYGHRTALNSRVLRAIARFTLSTARVNFAMSRESRAVFERVATVCLICNDDKTRVTH